MKMFVSISDESALWPHFVRYYHQMGVNEFFVATLPTTLPLPAVRENVRVRTFPRIPPGDMHMGGHTVTYELRRQFVGPEEWHWIADLDEFHELDRPLDQLLAQATALGYNSVGGRFVDRITADGSLPAIGDQDLFEQFPVECDITHKLLGAHNRKVMLIRGPLASRHIYHSLQGERPFPTEMTIYHFKWNASVLSMLTTRLRQEKENGWAHWGESKRFMSHLETHGRINLNAVRRLGFARSAARAATNPPPSGAAAH